MTSHENRLFTANERLVSPKRAQALSIPCASSSKFARGYSFAPVWKAPKDRKSNQQCISLKCHFDHQLETTFNPVLTLIVLQQYALVSQKATTARQPFWKHLNHIYIANWFSKHPKSITENRTFK